MRYPYRDVWIVGVMTLVIVAMILATALSIGDREPERYIGLDRAAASCAQIDSTIPFTRQHCIANGQPFLCVREQRSSVWQCARLGVQAAEAQ